MLAVIQAAGIVERQAANPVAQQDAWASLQTTLTACKGINVKNKEFANQLHHFLQDQLTAIESITSISKCEFKPSMLQSLTDLMSILPEIPESAAATIGVALYAIKMNAAFDNFTELGYSLADMVNNDPHFIRLDCIYRALVEKVPASNPCPISTTADDVRQHV